VTLLTTNVQIRGTKREMRNVIRKLPGYISGRIPDTQGIGRAFKSHFTFHWFEKVRDAYLVKSAGGTDDAGIKWAKNTKKTIAGRPVRPGDTQRLVGDTPFSQRTRGLLTPAQDALWRGIFKSNYLRLRSRTSEADAKATAAKIAWGILKKLGAQTKLDVLGSRDLPIGRATNRLFDACSPGQVSDIGYLPPKEQKVQYHHGGMTFSILVPYAGYFHSKRKIWPTQRGARGWVRHAAKAGLESLVRKVSQGDVLRSSPVRLYRRYPWLSPASPFRWPKR
jgi:hypothetical protein